MNVFLVQRQVLTTVSPEQVAARHSLGHILSAVTHDTKVQVHQTQGGPRSLVWYAHRSTGHQRKVMKSPSDCRDAIRSFNCRMAKWSGRTRLSIETFWQFQAGDTWVPATSCQSDDTARLALEAHASSHEAQTTKLMMAALLTASCTPLFTCLVQPQPVSGEFGKLPPLPPDLWLGPLCKPRPSCQALPTPRTLNGGNCAAWFALPVSIQRGLFHEDTNQCKGSRLQVIRMLMLSFKVTC